jgi:hypothetical protein
LTSFIELSLLSKLEKDVVKDIFEKIINYFKKLVLKGEEINILLYDVGKLYIS